MYLILCALLLGSVPYNALINSAAATIVLSSSDMLGMEKCVGNNHVELLVWMTRVLLEK